MRQLTLTIFFLTISYILSGCSTSTAVATNSAPESSTAVPPESPTVEDQVSLIKAIQSAGATAEVVDTISQPFFTPEGVFVTINDEEDIQVFEYKDAQTMENEASQVAPDGGSVGTSMMMWVDEPHFYKAGRIIVLYIGSTPTILDLLDRVMGSQIAGQ